MISCKLTSSGSVRGSAGRLALFSLLAATLAGCGHTEYPDYFKQDEIAPVPVTRQITPGLLDNGAEFDSPFYNQATLRHGAEPLRLNATVAKNYQFPTFYGDVTTAVAMFFCDYDEAQKILPHAGMRPVSMASGRALIIFSSYQYNKVLGIGPYREIAISIPVLVGNDSSTPVYPLLASDYPGMGIYVLSMPVTSLENKIRGVEIWGLGKVVETIDFSVEDGGYRTAATDGAGNRYLEFFVPFEGDETEIERDYKLYTMRRGELLRSTSRNKGVYLVRRRVGNLFGSVATPDREYLKIGPGPMGDTLRRLKIEPSPFQIQFGRDVSSTFDLPEPDFKAP